MPALISLDTEELTRLIGQWLWPMFRIAAAVWIMPLFGGQSIPARVRMGLVVMLTFVIAPSITDVPKVEALSGAAVVLTLQQVVIGLTLGFMVKLWLVVFSMGGQIISMQMGLSMALMNDPVNGSGTAVLGTWIQNTVSLMFLAMDGFLVVFTVLLRSFEALPIGAMFGDIIWSDLAKLGAWLYASSLLVALPAVISMLIVNMAFGVMNRAAPQLNIISLGFPMTMMFGLITVYFSMNTLPGIMFTITNEALQNMQLLLSG